MRSEHHIGGLKKKSISSNFRSLPKKSPISLFLSLSLSLSLPWIQASGGFKLFVGAVEAATASVGSSSSSGGGGIQASI
jgi:hypothetical protein